MTTETHSPRGSYLEMVSSLQQRYPNCDYLLEELRSQQQRPNHADSGGALVLASANHGEIQMKKCASPQELDTCLKASTSCRKREPRKRLFILEDIALNYIEVVGMVLSVDPTVFANHLRFPGHEQRPKIPSQWDPTRSFTLKYHELIHLRTHEHYRDRLFCDSNVYRRIHFHSGISIGYKVGVVDRMVNFWLQPHEDGGWNGVLLVDPAIGGRCRLHYRGQPERSELDNLEQEACNEQRRASRRYKSEHDESQTSSPRQSNEDSRRLGKLYQGGYVDIAKWPMDQHICDIFTHTATGFIKRNCLLEDIQSYVQEELNILPNSGDRSSLEPTVAIQIAKSIVVANWMVLIQYLQKVIHQLDWYADCYVDKTKKLSILSIRCREFREEVSSNIRQLGLQGAREAYPDSERLREHDNWSYILAELDEIIVQVHLYHEVFSTKAKEKRQQEAHEREREIDKRDESIDRRITMLTVLGGLFLPLSLATSLLSMGGDFLPGKRAFWVYFTVAIPLTTICFLFGLIWLQMPPPTRKEDTPKQHTAKQHTAKQHTAKQRTAKNPYVSSLLPV